MDIRQITDDFAASPQITPGDVAALKEAGFRAVICNRPDSEVSGDETTAAISAACAEHGVSFFHVPVDQTGLTEALVADERAALDAADGPVLGYCRSGTRSTNIWALARAGDMDPDRIIAAGARGGYDLTGLRPTLEALSRR